MAAFGDGYPYAGYNSVWSSAGASTTQNVTWTFTDTTGYPPQPFVAVPVQPVAVEIDDSPLTWLRSQVAEITELASAA